MPSGSSRCRRRRLRPPLLARRPRHPPRRDPPQPPQPGAPDRRRHHLDRSRQTGRCRRVPLRDPRRRDDTAWRRCRVHHTLGQDQLHDRLPHRRRRAGMPGRPRRSSAATGRRPTASGRAAGSTSRARRSKSARHTVIRVDSPTGPVPNCRTARRWSSATTVAAPIPPDCSASTTHTGRRRGSAMPASNRSDACRR